MDEQTPEMDQISAEMREIMRRWIQNPEDHFLRQRFHELQSRYQEMFIAYRRAGNGLA